MGFNSGFKGLMQLSWSQLTAHHLKESTEKFISFNNMC